MTPYHHDAMKRLITYLKAAAENRSITSLIEWLVLEHEKRIQKEQRLSLLPFPPLVIFCPTLNKALNLSSACNLPIPPAELSTEIVDRLSGATIHPLCS